MNIDTWAVVLATAIGPIIAVSITLWRESVADKYSRRLDVFRVLMSTRKTAISQDHVRALNLVEVDFYGLPSVGIAWQKYIDHLNSNPHNDSDWIELKEKLLADLLFQMALKLRFGIPALKIFKSGYAPVGWEYKENMQNGVLDYINDLSSGKKTLPIYVAGSTASNINSVKSVDPS